MKRNPAAAGQMDFLRSCQTFLVKLSAYSLKTGIFVILVIILLSGMILLDVVMIRMTERGMLKAEIEKGEVLLHAIEQDMIPHYKRQKAIYPSYQNLHHLLDETHLSAAIIINANGSIIVKPGQKVLKNWRKFHEILWHKVGYPTIKKR
jgi:hypothetical protein